MTTKHISIACLAFFLAGSCQLQVLGQGGWRQWDIHLRDGSTKLATPLGVNEKGHFTYSMGDEPVIERSKVSYLVIRARDLPLVPEGEFDKDLVVFLDGSRSFGAVIFRDVKFSEGTILQNGKEMTLQNVAYIKFAKAKKMKVNRNRKTNP